MKRICMMVAALLLLVCSPAMADTFDNSTAAAIANNGITVDGNLSDWGVAGTNYAALSAWNQWYDGGYDNGYQPGHTTPGITTSRVAIDTVNNRLMVAIETTQACNYGFELNGLFGGTNIDGQKTNRSGVVGQSDGTQIHFMDSGTPAAPGSGSLAIGGYEILRAGAVVPGISANTAGCTGAYTYDGQTLRMELSIAVKKDWTLADASLANTYDLSQVVAGQLQIAFNPSFFNPGDAGYGAYCQAARYNGTQYGDAIWTKDHWMQRASNMAGTGEFGGLTTVGVPEPATMSLLALGGLALLRRRK